MNKRRELVTSEIIMKVHLLLQPGISRKTRVMFYLQVDGDLNEFAAGRVRRLTSRRRRHRSRSSVFDFSVILPMGCGEHRLIVDVTRLVVVIIEESIRADSSFAALIENRHALIIKLPIDEAR